MRPLLLTVAILAWTLVGSALAEGNRTLTCSVSGSVAGCMIEQPLYVFGPFEVAFGVDAQYGYGLGRTSFFAPYTLIGYYGDRWSVWAEFALPNHRVPTFGKPESWRLGWRLRF